MEWTIKLPIYKKDTKVLYNNKEYTCIKEHRPKVEYSPDKTINQLWKVKDNSLQLTKEDIKKVVKEAMFEFFQEYKIMNEGNQMITPMKW